MMMKMISWLHFPISSLFGSLYCLHLIFVIVMSVFVPGDDASAVVRRSLRICNVQYCHAVLKGHEDQSNGSRSVQRMPQTSQTRQNFQRERRIPSPSPSSSSLISVLSIRSDSPVPSTSRVLRSNSSPEAPIPSRPGYWRCISPENGDYPAPKEEVTFVRVPWRTKDDLGMTMKIMRRLIHTLD